MMVANDFLFFMTGRAAYGTNASKRLG